jgi:hypothetical protein
LAGGVRLTAVVALAVLLAGSGSVIPAGAATLTLLVNVVAAAGATPLIVSVTLPPAGSVGKVHDPETATGNVSAGHDAPPLAEHAVSSGLTSEAGGVSVTVAPSAAAGPALLTTIE